MIRIIALVLIISTAIPALGCRSKSGSSAAGEDAGRIELWDGQVRQVKIPGLNGFHAEVKYRFVEGRPNPNLRYEFELNMVVLYTLANVMGKDLQPEDRLNSTPLWSAMHNPSQCG